MTLDRQSWDQRHRDAPTDLPAPDPFVVAAIENLGLSRPMRAVDLAAGRGRHALWLAQGGHDVEAWDASEEGLRRLVEAAAARSLAVHPRRVDLESVSWPHTPRFDLAVLVNFLSRPVLARIATILAPGGRLVFTTFTVDHPGERPRAAYRLQRGELTRGVPGLVTEWYEEQYGRAGIVARRPDANPGSD